MYERLVRSTKRCLKKVISTQRLTYEELNTILIDVESVLNSRPITYLYENDVEVPISPSHLFCGRRVLDKEEHTAIMEEEFEISRKDLLLKAMKNEAVVEYFRKRWCRDRILTRTRT